jgi:hypothetical protein
MSPILRAQGIAGVHSYETRHNAEVGFLRKLFGRSDEPAEDAPIALDVDARGGLKVGNGLKLRDEQPHVGEKQRP